MESFSSYAAPVSSLEVEKRGSHVSVKVQTLPVGEVWNFNSQRWFQLTGVNPYCHHHLRFSHFIPQGEEACESAFLF